MILLPKQECNHFNLSRIHSWLRCGKGGSGTEADNLQGRFRGRYKVPRPLSAIVETPKARTLETPVDLQMLKRRRRHELRRYQYREITSELALQTKLHGRVLVKHPKTEEREAK